MKILLSVVISSILFFSIFQVNAQITKDKSYVINGKITGIDSGIISMLSINRDVINNAAIVKGKFVLRGEITLPERKSFLIMPGNWEFSGFVDGSVITFDIDTLLAGHQYEKAIDYPIIWQIKQTGSPMADVYAEYQAETAQNDYLILFEKLKTAKKDSIAHINSEMDSINKITPVKEKLLVENYVHQNPSSLPGIFIFYEYCRTSSDISENYLRSFLNKFSGAAKASSYYAELTKKLAALTSMQIGKPAPDFTLLKRNNDKFKLSTTRGTVTMLDFWASWCVPCRKGIPHWKKVYTKYKGPNIISVSDDRYWSAWVRAIDQEKMPWTQVIDKFPLGNAMTRTVVSDLYTAPSLPFFVLIDRKGDVILASGDELIVTKKIEEIMK